MVDAQRARVDLITIQLAVVTLNQLQKGEEVRVTIPGRADALPGGGTVDTVVILMKANR